MCVISLYELHLSLNELPDVQEPPSEYTHSHLKELFLNRNNLHDWQGDICKLGRVFPCLENLVMIRNPLSQLPEDTRVLQSMFPCLRALNLSHTKLDCWTEIEKVKHFPALVNLRITGLDFLEVS